MHMFLRTLEKTWFTPKSLSKSKMRTRFMIQGTGYFWAVFPSCELLFTTGLANGDPCGSVLLVRFRCVVKTTKFAKIQKPYRRRVRPRNMPLWCWGMIVGHPPSSWPRLRFGPSRRALVGKTPPRDTTLTYVKKILYEQEKIYSMEKAGWSPS